MLLRSDQQHMLEVYSPWARLLMLPRRRWLPFHGVSGRLVCRDRVGYVVV